MFQRTADLIEDLEFLVETGATLDETCRRFGKKRYNLETWCSRHGVSHLYQILVHRSHICQNRCLKSKYHNFYPTSTKRKR